VNARIAAVATAVPEHVVVQHEAGEFARRVFGPHVPDIERLVSAFANTGIERRYLVRPLDWFEAPRPFAEKNAVYCETALELSLSAATRALGQANIDRADVGAILFVSTTGVATPSLDSFLIQRLGLSRSAVRLPVWGLGCAGGAAGLARAAELATTLGRPTLLVAVEVCSTTFVPTDRSRSNVIATALFGDGAAAVVLRPDGEGPEVLSSYSYLLDDSKDVMGWRVEADGLRVVFARSIPKLVRDLAGRIASAAAAGAGVSRADLANFVFHPGGAKVLRAYADTLGLDGGDLRHASGVLRDYGNMSSPSVLFVLERFLREDAATGRPALLMALGPGFSAESVVLRW
jgi:alkylresorcinol/alkylpyrone synthase